MRKSDFINSGLSQAERKCLSGISDFYHHSCFTVMLQTAVLSEDKPAMGIAEFVGSVLRTCSDFNSNRLSDPELERIFGPANIDLSIQDELTALLREYGFTAFPVGDAILSFLHREGDRDNVGKWLLIKIEHNTVFCMAKCSADGLCHLSVFERDALAEVLPGCLEIYKLILDCWT